MTEKKARAGGGVARPGSGCGGGRGDDGVSEEFKGFQGEVKTALQQQEERLTMLNAKTMTYGRPALSAAAEVDAPHKKAFNAYLRNGR